MGTESPGTTIRRADGEETSTESSRLALLLYTQVYSLIQHHTHFAAKLIPSCVLVVVTVELIIAASILPSGSDVSA